MIDRHLRITPPDGGTLIAIRNNKNHERILLDIGHSDYTALKITQGFQNLVLCCVYNAPFPTGYRWDLNVFLNLIDKLHEKCRNHAPCQLIIIGDINFSHTNWSQMCSTNDYETEVIERLISYNMTNCSCDKLDVVLVKETESINQCTYQHQVSREYNIAVKICSDLPLKTKMNLKYYNLFLRLKLKHPAINSPTNELTGMDLTKQSQMSLSIPIAIAM